MEEVKTKTYWQNMYDISADKLYEGLLGYGMFCEKLPQVFTSRYFYDYCKKYDSTFQNKYYDFIRYNSIRNTKAVRMFGIPTPMAYQNLCKFLSEHWEEICEYFRNMTEQCCYKVSRIHIRKRKNSHSLFKMNYSNWRYDGTVKADLRISKRYLVKADISNCFPSLYTHAIPWALVGKNAAKGNKKSKEWWNQIDQITRNCKFGETHGLLIGPHASNLLAEIVLVAIDKVLVDMGYKFIRHIDDYTCFTDSLADAYKFIHDLSTELEKYDLALNNKKTKIEELPTEMNPKWQRIVKRTDRYNINGQFNHDSAVMYFDEIIELIKEYGDIAIANYAIKALPRVMTEQAKQYCVKISMHLALNYPYLVTILDEQVFGKFDVPKRIVECFVNELYKREIENRNYEGVSYAVYFAIKYDVRINNIDVEDVINSPSCIMKILAYLYYKQNNRTDDIIQLENHANRLSKEDFERNWIFVYEVLSAKELSGDWKELKKAGVSFIDKTSQW